MTGVVVGLLMLMAVLYVVIWWVDGIDNKVKRLSEQVERSPIAAKPGWMEEKTPISPRLAEAIGLVYDEESGQYVDPRESAR